MKYISVFPLSIGLALLQINAQQVFSQTFTNGDWTYTLNASNEATIIGYGGSGGGVVIPSDISGFSVKALGADLTPVLSQSRGPVTNVVISTGIKTIGDWAFEGGGKLAQITIPDTVESIGWKAFAYCGALTKIDIPGSVATIGGEAFFGCSALTNVGLANGLKSIGSGAFYRCAISNIVIPNTVTNIDTLAFQECFALTCLHIPSTVISVGGGFAAGSPLNGISVDPNNPIYESIDGVVFEVSPSTLVQFPGARSGFYAIPTNVSKVATFAFALGSIQNVSVPTSVREIEAFAFDGSRSLTNVTFSDGTTTIDNYAFRWTSLLHIALPDSLRRVGLHAFEACHQLTDAHIGSGLSEIEWVIFESCSSLTNISVAETNTNYSSLDGVLFNKQQTEIVRFPIGRSGSYTVPSGVTAIAKRAFGSASHLSRVFLPEGLTEVGWGAFDGCVSLLCISMPTSVTNVSAFAFHGTTHLVSATFQGAPTAIADNAFANCGSLTGVIFLDNAPALVSMPLFSTDSSATIYRLPNKSGWSNSFAGRPTALIDCLFTEQQFRDGAAGYTSGRSQGRSDVTTNPSAFNLFTQQQFDNNRTTGQSDVINSPMSYGLYTSNSIMDLRMGGLMIQKVGTNAVVSFQPQTTTDLTLPFTNNGTPITNTIPMPGNKGFIRINAKP